MAIEGPLKELSIQDVLQLLDLAHKTGVLTVRSDRWNDEAIIHFAKGTIIFAVRRRSTRRLGQLLIRAGRLTQRELDRALEIQRTNPTRRLAEVLLEMGSIAEDVLEQQLRFQMEETVYEVMAWTEGYFRFEERADMAGPRLLARVRVESLLMEGARRIDEWTRLESKVPSPESIPVLAPTADRTDAPLDLRPEEWEVLAQVDGERDVRQIAADLARSSFDVAKTIFGLVSTGVVDVEERHTRISDAQMQATMQDIERLMQDGELEQAQKLASELESSYPERADIALLSGRTLLSQGRMRAATEAFARAALLDPMSADAHFHLGYSAVQTGDLQRTANAWETYLRVAPIGTRRELVANGLIAVRDIARIVDKGLIA